MVTSLLPNPVASSPTRQSGQPLATEFRLLGLRPREARLDVIRGAVKDTASDVKAADEWSSVEDSSSVARVAVAGYRLLDPRRRRTLFERVQLLLWTDEDVPASAMPLWNLSAESVRQVGESAPSGTAVVELPTAASEPARVVAMPVGSQQSPPVSAAAVRALGKLPEQDRRPLVASELARVEETRAALELFRSLRKRDRRAMALWVSICALALSLLLTVGLIAALI